MKRWAYISILFSIRIVAMEPWSDAIEKHYYTNATNYVVEKWTGHINESQLRIHPNVLTHTERTEFIKVAESELRSTLASGNPPQVCFARDDRYAPLLSKILTFGMSANRKNGQGHTALHTAVDTSSITNVRVLLAHNADVSAVDGNGDTPLTVCAKTISINAYMATEELNFQIMQLLLEHGAPVNSCDLGGYTALHALASFMPQGIFLWNVALKRRIDLLLQYNIDTSLGSHSRKYTACALAHHVENHDLAAYIETEAAKRHTAIANLRSLEGTHFTRLPTDLCRMISQFYYEK